MSFTYDLTTEPWIPSVMADGSTQDLSLLDVLSQAPQIREVLDASPLVTVALHRLLLTILHRLFGPRDVEEWECLWNAGGFDEQRVGEYFAQWQRRFDLFDKQKPFYQTPGLPPQMLKPVSLLSQEWAAGNNDTLFDHNVDARPTAISPAKAARLLVARQAFSLGGLVTAEAGRASAKAAPLARAAVTLIQGENLFRTLMLNLVLYDPTADLPMPCQDDVPAWERDEPVVVRERAPRGYLDYLTWQSRRIWLRPESEEGGETTVKQVIVADGERFPNDSAPKDPMVPHKVKRNFRPGQNPLSPLRLEPSRALWRDSLALMQAEAQMAQDILQCRPSTLDHVATLLERDFIPRSQVRTVSVLGLCAERAKVHFWRHERLPLPLAYLIDNKLLADLRRCLVLAQKTADRLNQAMHQLAETILAPAEGEKADSAAVHSAVQSLRQPDGYWSDLGLEFPSVLLALPGKDAIARNKICAQWARTVEEAAWRVWDQITAWLPGNARCWRAAVVAVELLRASLGHLRRPYKEVMEHEAQGA